MRRPSRRKRKTSIEKPENIALPQIERQVLRNRFAPIEPLNDERPVAHPGPRPELVG